MINRRLGWTWPARMVVVVLLGVLMVLAPAVPADELDDDFRFASGLIDLGFPDFAEKVVQQVLRLHPDQKDRAQLIQAEILISRGKFGEAGDLVKTMGAENPKAQAISLALAKGYYAAGDMEKSKQLYNDFFRQYEGRTPTDPDLLRFYQESAYQFGQMLEQSNDKAGAVKAYDRVLGTKPDRGTSRQLQARQADLYVQMADGAALDVRDRNLAAAKKICEAVQWGGIDIPFGHSVITMAHIQLVLGDRAGAQKVLTSNMDILKEIDTYIKEQQLPLSESPMAGARFLLGRLYREQADGMAKSQDQKAGAVDVYVKALVEYYNVFAKYGASEWGPGAGVQAQEIKTILESRYGKKVNVDLGAYQTKAAEAQFRLADNLFRQKQYKGAVDEYLKNLNQFPETESGPNALASLALSYANLDDKLMVKAVCSYLAERFADKDQAGTGLLIVGKFYFNRKDEPMYLYAYEEFLKYFPKHERAAAILFTLANLRRQANDPVNAIKYYEQIVNNYPKDQYYPRALSQLAWGYFLGSNYEAAVTGFTKYLAEAQPGLEKAQAEFALADSYRTLGRLKEALAEYEKLIQWLAPKDNPNSASAADVQKNTEILERAVFQRAHCYARMNEPTNAVPAYRAQSLKAYDAFLQLFPQSKLAPKALSGKGSVLLELGQFDTATKTFDELASKYPESDEGKNALFALTRSALEIKQYDQARSAFQKMIGGGGAFAPEEFLRLGQMLLDARMWAEAVQSFERVTTSPTQERSLLERAFYGLGRAYFEQQKYPEAIQALETLMTRYPRSGLFYDAKFTLCTAYQQTGRLDDAVKALSDVSKFAEKPFLIYRASFDLGTIQKQRGEKQQALASFLRVALLADPNDAQLRPLIEQACFGAIELAMELQRHQDVQDSCDQYLKLFPTGDKVEEVRKAKADAKLKAAQAAAARATPPQAPHEPEKP
jgi:tetratricopeptide (TPR) repeat protein